MATRKLPALVLSAALVLIAIFCHLFYVEYRASTTDLIFKIRDADQNNEVTNARVEAIASLSPLSLYRANNGWYKKNASLTANERSDLSKLIAANPYVGDPRVAQIIAENLARDAYLKKTWANEKLRQELITNARGVVVPYGIAPSKNVGGSDRLRKRDAFWFGIILPISLLAGALTLFASHLGARAQHTRKETGLKLDTAKVPTEPGASNHLSAPPIGVLTETLPPEQKSLAQLLIDDLGSEFPVSSGNGKRDDPLLITAERDYVSVEYAAVRHVLGAVREEYKLTKQQLISEDNRQIDELIFDVKPIGANEWTGRRSFYFDITSGYNKLGT